MPKKQLAILTVADDLHALAVQRTFEGYSDVRCSIVEANRLCRSGSLTWHSSDRSICALASLDGEPVDVSRLDVVWWRRVNVAQRLPASVVDQAHTAIIDNDTRVALRGLLLTEFGGRWVNEPYATDSADNKLVQLRAAELAGFHVPRTLVSQNPDHIREFCRTHGYRVVVKPVYGAREARLVTAKVTEEGLRDEEGLKLCPAIYQEYVPGRLHVRASCFGEHVYAALIDSELVDWRTNYNAPMRAWSVPEDLRSRIRKVLDILGLRMGIIDIKLTPSGEPIWLEVNPQGQFLFVEALCGLELTARFAEFLYEEAGSERTGPVVG